MGKHAVTTRARGVAFVITAALFLIPASAFGAAGDISVFAGNGTNATSGDGGAATSAALMGPLGMAVAPNGDIYFADYDAHRVRRVTTAGIISTVAGNGTAGLSGDGAAATAARLRNPIDVAVDSLGRIFIVDAGNHRVRMVALDGTISTYAGTIQGYSGDGGAATAARLDAPWGIEVDAAGTVWLSDSGNDRVRKITSGGVITTVAGTGVAGSSGDGGAATSATLNSPSDVTVDAGGNLYISEYDGNRVRKVTPGGTISRFAGTGGGGSTGDGGLATAAQVNAPWGLETDSAGNVYIVEIGGSVVRKVSGLGVITRFAGTGSAGYSGNGGPATSAQISAPAGFVVAPNGHGHLAEYSNHRLRRIDSVSVPEAPSVTARDTASPGTANTLKILGSAPSSSTVRLYTDSACTSAVAATGTAADFASPGLSVTVASDSTTTFYATASNAAGASACSATSVSYVEDSTAPVQPTVTVGPSSPGKVRSVAWEWTGEGGSTSQCKLERGATLISDWASCTSPKSYDLTGEADGTYTFSVRSRDALLNTSTAATATYQLDTTAPAAPVIDTSPPATGTGRSPQWAFTGEPSATFECRVDRGATEVYAWGGCGSPATVDLTLKPDGAYTWSVRQTDAAGNQGPTTTGSYTLDTTGPATSIAAAPASPGSGRSPEWTFSSETGATDECKVDRGVTPVDPWDDCSNPATVDLTGEPNGTYTLSVRATDTLGNTGTTTTSDYTLDASLPATPTIDVAAPSPRPGKLPQWQFSSSEGGVTFRCRLARGATEVESWAACTSPHTYDLDGEPDGTYTFQVRARNALLTDGAPASVNYVLDTAKPAPPSVTAPPSPSADETPSWTWTGEAGAQFDCRLERGVDVVDDWGDCTSPYQPDLSAEADGSYVLHVRAEDAAGNVGDPGSASAWVLDTTKPPLPDIDSNPAPVGSGRSPQWSFSSAAPGTFECRLSRGATEVEPWDACTSAHTYTIAGVDGTYTFEVRMVNPLGTPGDPRTGSYVLDTLDPPAPDLLSTPGDIGSSRSPAWSFDGETGATFQCRVMRGTDTIEGWGTCTSPKTAALTGLPDGIYSFSVRARDAALNIGPDVTHAYELDATAPAEPAIGAKAASPGNTRTPSWSWTTEAGSTSECSLARPGGETDAWAACTSPASRDLAGAPDGRYEMRVRGVDAAANRGTAAAAVYELDTQPGALALTGGPASVTREAAPSFTWSGESGASFRCRVMRGDDVRTDWGPCSSPHTVEMSGDPDGQYTFAVAATDAAGNATPAAEWRFAIDRSAPAQVSYDAKPPARARDKTPEWTFASDEGARYECRVKNGNDVVEDWHECESPVKVDLREEDDGTYTLEVRAIDEAGNVALPVQTSYRLDTTDPAAPDITVKPTATDSDRTPTWGFRAESGADLECRLKQEGEDAPAWRACESPKTYDLDGKPETSFTFAVRARDIAGNTGLPATDAYRLRDEVASSGGGGADPAPGAASPATDGTPAAPGPADPGAPGAAPADDATAPEADDAEDAAGDDDDGGTKAGGAAGRGGPGVGAGKGQGGAGQGAGGAAAAAEEDKKRRKRPGNVAEKALQQIAQVGAVIAESPEKGVFPMSLIFVVVGFMGLQSRMDRNDPKLALAPVFADPDLEFRPPRAARAGIEG